MADLILTGKTLFHKQRTVYNIYIYIYIYIYNYIIYIYYKYIYYIYIYVYKYIYIYIYKYIYLCMHSWKQCTLPVITTKALWQLMHLGNHTSCAQVHELPQSHCDDNLQSTLFSWLHIFYAHLASVRFKCSMCREHLCPLYIYDTTYICNIHIDYIYTYMHSICMCIHIHIHIHMHMYIIYLFIYIYIYIYINI